MCSTCDLRDEHQRRTTRVGRNIPVYLINRVATDDLVGLITLKQAKLKLKAYTRVSSRLELA